MSEVELNLCRNCCLTLGNLKVGSLFACEDDCRLNMRACLRGFYGKGIRFAELNELGDRRLMYVYNADMLRAVLADSEVAAFLQGMGYDCSSISAVIAELRNRVREGGEFPHEIGVFLGYALEDVKGFIESPRSGVLLTGYWKVYSDVAAKARLFEGYRRYSEAMCDRLIGGQPLLTLF